MQLTNFNNITFTLSLAIVLLFLAEYATAEYCCYVGGCSGTDPTCVPCKIMTSCGQYPLCMGYTCQRAGAEEGVLSPETIAAEARKLRQDVVEGRKAQQHLDDRKGEDNFEQSNLKELFKKDNARKDVVEDRKANEAMTQANAKSLDEKRNVGDEGKAHSIDA